MSREAEPFSSFWSLYPRRVAKRAALKAWEKEMRSGTNPEEIIEGLRRQLAHLLAKEAQFIPHPATWLNQGRWEDEVNEQPVRKPEPRKSAFQERHENARERIKRALGITDDDKQSDFDDGNIIDLSRANYRG